MKKISLALIRSIKFVIRVLLYPIYWLSYLFPRDKNKWVFGSFGGAFNDNAKHFFLFLCEKHPEVDAAWISRNRKTVKEVSALGVKAYWLFSVSGIWRSLRSYVWLYNCYTEDICFYLSGGAKKVDLWHGAVPIKKIEYDVQNGPLGDRYNRTRVSDRITHPFCFQKPDLLLTASDYMTSIFARAFRIPLNQCVQIGCPKNVIQLCDECDRRRFINTYENTYVKSLIEKMAKYDTVYIYMPTWRDSQRNAFAQHFRLDELQKLMEEQDSLMLLKPHVNTTVSSLNLEKYSNILALDNKLDVYPILPYTNVLVTDYSSIMYEYMLMKDKGILLYTYDFDEYVKDRELYFDMETHSIGVRCGTFEELKHAMLSRNYELDPDRVNFIREKFWSGLEWNNSNEYLFERLRQM